MNKIEIIEKLKKANLNFDYTLVYGTSLVMHGIRPETKDIDLQASKAIVEKLIIFGYEYRKHPFNDSKIVEIEDLDVGCSMDIDSIDIIDGFKCQSLESILKCKLSYTREKDISDIELLKKAISEKYKQFSIDYLSDYTELRTAEWVEDGDNQPVSCDKVYSCSHCGNGRRFSWQVKPFCENCGAKMINFEIIKNI